MDTKEKEFISIINDNQRVIHKVCSIYTDSKEAHQDLFQETVYQLWKSFPSFKNQSKITTWIYKVTLHTAITAIKRNQKSKKIVTELEGEISGNSHYYTENTENDMMGQLQQAISKLNNAEKALVLLYLEEKSYKEISDIMGITESNVGVRLNRIKSKLKAILNV